MTSNRLPGAANSDRTRGAAAIEFALVLPLFILLVFGIVEFGRAYNAKVTLTHAAREAVREYVINGDATDAETTGEDAAPNLSGADVSITQVCTGVSGDRAIAEATWVFDYNIPLFKSGTHTLTETAVMRCGA